MREKYKLKMARLFWCLSDSKSPSLCWLQLHGEGKQVIARDGGGEKRQELRKILMLDMIVWNTKRDQCVQ